MINNKKRKGLNLELRAVLFDLDNTLILFEEDKFFTAYTKKLYLSFRDLLSPQKFAERLMYATLMMTKNDGKTTNAEFFVRHFADGIPISSDQLWLRFEKFYATEFEQFHSLMAPLAGAREIVINLKKRGLKLVIATNPMFPINVQLIRLRWANLDDICFDLITSADNSNYCKPNLHYYHEICQKIKLLPEQCLMVGNDAFNDMIAAKTGMKTYLATDSDHLSIELSRALAKHSKVEMPAPDFKGPLSELCHTLEKFKLIPE
ncbi:MAG: HAD family hydrolase [bacterium]|nr:HAD family hydrolase [bacterium]